jgi:hypothetical protein
MLLSISEVVNPVNAHLGVGPEDISCQPDHGKANPTRRIPVEVLAGTSGLRINKLKRPGFSYVHPLLMEQIASAVLASGAN